MRNKNALLGFISVLLCQGLLASPGGGRDAATEVAQKGYRQFLEKCLTPAGRAGHGISPMENIAEASLGEAIEKMNLTPQGIASYQLGQGVSKLLTTNNGFFFPVFFRGEAKLFLSVHKWPGNNHYEISALGDSFLADEYTKIKAQLFCSKVYPMAYAECYEANACVFTFPALDDQNLSFINLDDARKSDYSLLGQVDEVVKVMNDTLDDELKPCLVKK